MSWRKSTVLVGGALLLGGSAFAQWSSDPAVNTMVSTPSLGYAFTQKVVSDGEGGVIIGWYDDRNGSNDIYAQHFDAMGRKLWGPDGIPVCVADNSQDDLRIASDGEGGALLAWDDSRAAGSGIYVQRLDASGNALWNTNGVRAVSNTSCCNVASDDAGGAIVSSDEQVNRVSASGTLMWGTADSPVVFAGSTSSPKLISDGAGGVYICDHNSEATLTRIDPSGSILWTATLSNTSASCSRVAQDGSGGAYVIWEDSPDFRVQRVSSSGQPLWSQPNGVLVASNYDNYGLGLVASGNGVIVTWSADDGNAHAARIANGIVVWDRALCTTGNYEFTAEPPALIDTDGKGGAIIDWIDSEGANYIVKVQRVSQTGDLLWGEGVRVSIATTSSTCGRLAGDGKGGVVVTWYDDKTGVGEIYAQKVSSSGSLGNGGHDHMWWCFAGSAQASGTAALGLLAGALALLGLSRLVRK